jgi:ankyrin repeat protein
MCVCLGVIAPQANGYTPLHVAASVGHSTIVNMLLERGIQSDKVRV